MEESAFSRVAMNAAAIIFLWRAVKPILKATRSNYYSKYVYQKDLLDILKPLIQRPNNQFKGTHRSIAVYIELFLPL